jgi:hypothetical protein
MSFLVSGFKKDSAFQGSTRDGHVTASSRANASGTNTGRKAARTQHSAADPGTTISAIQPVFATGALVTGTAANNASVSFFVPSPANVHRQNASDRTEVAPDFVSVVDAMHLELGLSCNPYAPAVQIKDTTRAVRVGAFYDSTSQLDCVAFFTVTLPSPIGTRDVVSDLDGYPLTNGECAPTSTTAMVEVPDVIGMTLSDAIAAVEAVGLHVVGHGTPRSDPTDDSAVVTAQEPSGPVRAGACVGFRTTTSH